MVMKIFLLLMIVFAVFAVQAKTVRIAVIYLGIFSLISSFVYLLYQAPDVAIAEAIIGSTLSTILYLTALQKHNIFSIYYTEENSDTMHDKYINKGHIRILNLIESFCVSKELEPHVVYTTEPVDQIIEHSSYDIIVGRKEDEVFIYGDKQNYQIDSLQEYVKKSKKSNVNFILQDETEGD